MAGEVNIDNSVQRQTEKLHGGTKTIQKSHNYVLYFQVQYSSLWKLKAAVQNILQYNYSLVFWLHLSRYLLCVHCN